MGWLAYLDPGMGSIVFQALAAGVVGMLVFFKSWRTWLAAMFFRPWPRKKPDDSNP